MIEFEYAHEGAVALLTLSRPPANAFTVDGLRQLQQVIEAFDREPQVRAVVI
ncbi:enoyl-CoA hydratase-related protein, partial [Paraburkholderia sp. BR10872]